MTGRKPQTRLEKTKRPDLTLEEIKSREKNTPLYEKAEFLIPEHFNDAEKKEWAELVELLKSIKGSAVTDADRKIMIIRVQAYAEYLRFDEAVKNEPKPYLIETKLDRGATVEQIVKNPYYDLRKKAGETVLKCDAELGLTPISRARTGIARTKGELDKSDTLLSGILNRKGDND